MRQYERSGVIVDQCGECRGIFLDRGELEKLFEAEAQWNRQQAGSAPPVPPVAQPHAPAQPGGYVPPPPPAHHQPSYAAPAPVPPPPPVSHGYPPAYGQQQHYGYHGHYRNKRQKGFLNELFD
jgi:Zn-finger nucleic acid-binding protein